MNSHSFKTKALSGAGTPKKTLISGFSLVELVVVIAIMGIVLSIATMNFTSWQEKNRVEGQTREIFADLNETRINAFTQKKQYGIVFQPNSYVINSYSSAVTTTASALTTGTPVTTKNLKYGLTKAGASIVNTPVVFDTNGINVEDIEKFTIFVNQGSAEQTASVNCIVISTSRANMGKINGTACEFK